MPALQAGAKRAGRSLDQFDAVVGFPTIVTPDASGIEQNKGQIVMFATAMGSSKFYAESFSQAGFSDEVRRIQELVARGDMKGAVAVVSDEMCDALTLSGTPDNVRKRIDAYRAAGAKTIALNPSPPGVYFPLFQGHFPDGTDLPAFSFPDFLKSIGDAIDFIGDTQGS
jgi:alkanesulfonate monooxygenase SsuD/methylene tetrahydromethanopterin reductase-like flavin-dependent oxidoreductase (luciferase family)